MKSLLWFTSLLAVFADNRESCLGSQGMAWGGSHWHHGFDDDEAWKVWRNHGKLWGCMGRFIRVGKSLAESGKKDHEAPLHGLLDLTLQDLSASCLLLKPLGTSLGLKGLKSWPPTTWVIVV